jgi:DNA modification methylase
MSDEILWGGCKYQPNNIYNVDCYEAIKELPDKSIDCIYVDVPYLIENKKINYVIKETQTPVKQRILKMANSLIDSDIYSGFDYSILDEFIRISKKVNIFIWCSKQQLIDIMNYFIVQNDYNFELLTWNKSNPTPMCNNNWLPDLEYCLYFRETGVHLNDGYENKSKWFCSPINKTDKAQYDHPTIKPLELVKRHIRHATQPNDIVLDCFLGSGTTYVASVEEGRRCIGFEKEKKYYEIAVNRANGISQADVRIKEAGIQSIFDFLD